MVKVKVYAITAVLQLIFGYPLVICVSSLCHYPCYFGVTKKINLNPLLDIICSSWPSSCFASSCQEVQPTLDCGMIAIPLWWGGDETAFHPQRFSARCVNNQKIILNLLKANQKSTHENKCLPYETQGETYFLATLYGNPSNLSQFTKVVHDKPVFCNPVVSLSLRGADSHSYYFYK